MVSLNDKYKHKIQPLGFRFPEIYLPKDTIPMETWSVIACDQHTSDEKYWENVAQKVGDKPSTLKLIYPEVYLEEKSPEKRIAKIHEKMFEYEKSEILEFHDAGLYYIERTTRASGLRQGLLLAMDLEMYDFSPDSTSLIRATEGTILERIPPRVSIRKGAPLELPHIMILIDDRDLQLIEPLKNDTDSMKKLYEANLMLDGGTIHGYKIEDDFHIQRIIEGLEYLGSKNYAEKAFNISDPFLFAMGDGNHSLATAKTVWETMKSQEIEKNGNWQVLAQHPARFALAEIVNLHSPGLRFEPIHRVLFNTSLEKFTQILEKEIGAKLEPMEEQEIRTTLEKTEHGQYCAGLKGPSGWFLITFPVNAPTLPNGLVDKGFMIYQESDKNASIDFIHGWEHTTNAAADSGSLALFFPVLSREKLFPFVATKGPLPRKAFSMGDAEEKRYYIESRKIINAQD